MRFYSYLLLFIPFLICMIITAVLALEKSEDSFGSMYWRKSEKYEEFEYSYSVYEGVSKVSEQNLVITAILKPSNLFFASLQDLSNKSHAPILSFIFNQEGRTYPSSLVTPSKTIYPVQKILSSILRLPPKFLLENLSTDIPAAPSGEDSMMVPYIPENNKNMIYFSHTGGLPFCLSVPEKHKIEKINSATRITLEKISKTLAGDELASYKYTFMENLRTTSEEIGQNDDFSCSYEGIHIFNLSKGYLESATGELSGGGSRHQDISDLGFSYSKKIEVKLVKRLSEKPASLPPLTDFNERLKIPPDSGEEIYFAGDDWINQKKQPKDKEQDPIVSVFYIKNANFAESINDIDSLIKKHRPNEVNSLHKDILISKHGIKMGEGAILTIRTFYPGYKRLIDDEAFENITLHCPSLPENIGDVIEYTYQECGSYLSSASTVWYKNGGDYGTALNGSIKLERLEKHQISLDINMLFESSDLDENGQRTRKDPVKIKGSYVAHTISVDDLRQLR